MELRPEGKRSVFLCYSVLRSGKRDKIKAGQAQGSPIFLMSFPCCALIEKKELFDGVAENSHDRQGLVTCEHPLDYPSLFFASHNDHNLPRRTNRTYAQGDPVPRRGWAYGLENPRLIVIQVPATRKEACRVPVSPHTKKDKVKRRHGWAENRSQEPFVVHSCMFTHAFYKAAF